MEKIKVLFFKRNAAAKWRNHFIFFLLSVLNLFFGDVLFAITGTSDILWLSKQVVTYTPVAILVCFLLSFASVWTKIVAIVFVFLPTIAQNLYFVYSGALAGCAELHAVVRETDDVIRNVGAVAKYTIILMSLFCALLFFTIRFRKKFHSSIACDVFVLCGFLGLFYLGRIMKHAYAVPLTSRITVMNTMRTLPYCLMHWNDKGKIEFPYGSLNATEIKLINKETPRIVLVIWGESTNVDFMSCFGDARFLNGFESTPNMTQFFTQQKKHFFARKAVSGAVATRVSTTLFFNLINTPTDVIKIAENRKQNLFKLAKENGYKTHWLSAFETNITEGKRFDTDTFISKDTHMSPPYGERDDFLLDKIKTLDVSEGKHFIGIQFNSVHADYAANYVKHLEFEKLKPTTNDDRKSRTRKEYINNILYLDYLISEVIKWGQKNGIDIIVYTSDHGEALGVNMEDQDGDIYGHNHHSIIDAKVPFFLYQKNPSREYLKDVEDKKILSHYEIAQIVAKALGYDIIDKNGVPDEFYLYNNTLYGDGVMTKRLKRLPNGDIKELFSGSLSDYYKKYFK